MPTQVSTSVAPYRISKGKGFRLKDFDPGDTCGLQLDKGEAAELLQHRHRVAGGRAGHALRPGPLVLAARLPGDGCGGQRRHEQARHVGRQSAGLSSVLVQAATVGGAQPGVHVELLQIPPRTGRIGIFNRSYYEEVLVVRVHPELLARQKLPPQLVGKRIWDKRLADIAHFEDYATRQGTKILKFFLHVSHKEQKKRFIQRRDEPEKNWKFSPSDVQERKFWDDYMHAFEEAIAATASKHAPWFVVPADNKWFSRLLVSAAIVEAMVSLDLPEARRREKKELAAARVALFRKR
jgi:hypothetical protein